MLDLAQATSAVAKNDGGGDIVGGTPQSWLAIGWFTPDYRPLAEKFAANLAEHGAPFHLFARAKLAKRWNTHQKPSVVLKAMDAYPGKTLILMDVDCIVRGDISPVAEISGDVGLTLKARQARKGPAHQKRIALAISSRVVVFRPSDGAQAFAREWEQQCARARYDGDETALGWTYLRSPGIAVCYLDERFQGKEVNAPSLLDGAVIVHDSAHDKTLGWSVKPVLKAIERRFFRTGRTKAESRMRLG